MRNPPRILIASDLHFPLQNDDAIDEFLKRVKATHPEWICLNGDLMDCESISSFSKDPNIPKLQEEIDITKDFLGRLKEAAGRGTWDVLLGNHEQRLQKLLLENPGLHGLEALKFHSLLGVPNGRVFDFGTPRFYGPNKEVCVYHTETVGKANRNNESRARDRISRTGAKIVVTGHLHAASTVLVHDRNGLGASVVTPCLQGNQEWSKPYPMWDIGWTEISFQPGRFPLIQQVVLEGGKQ